MLAGADSSAFDTEGLLSRAACSWMKLLFVERCCGHKAVPYDTDCTRREVLGSWYSSFATGEVLHIDW